VIQESLGKTSDFTSNIIGAKRAGSMAQAVVGMYNKLKSLSSNPRTVKNNNNKKNSPILSLFSLFSTLPSSIPCIPLHSVEAKI
jgi:hypothetical protein